MSIYSNVTEQDLIHLRKLAEQQKDQRALKNKNGISKQTHDVKLAERFSPITRKLDIIIETTRNLGEIITKSNIEDGNTQTLAIQIKIGTQPLRDLLALMKRWKNFFKLEEKKEW